MKILSAAMKWKGMAALCVAVALLLAPSDARAQTKGVVAYARQVADDMTEIERRADEVSAAATKVNQGDIAALADDIAAIAASQAADARAFADSVENETIKDQQAIKDKLAEYKAKADELRKKVDEMIDDIEKKTVGKAKSYLKGAAEEIKGYAKGVALTAKDIYDEYSWIIDDIKTVAAAINTILGFVDVGADIVQRQTDAFQKQAQSVLDEISNFKIEADLSVDKAVGITAGDDVDVDIGICKAYAGANAAASAEFGTDFSGKLDFGKACEGMMDFSIGGSASASASASAGYECKGLELLDIVPGPCESKYNAQKALDWFAKYATQDFNFFIQELVKFIDLDLSRTATIEMVTRIAEYDHHLYAPLNNWWDDDNDDCNGTTKPCTATLPAMRAMMRQISLAKITQTMHIGFMYDAKMMSERMHARQKAIAKIYPRYALPATSCQIDKTGPALSASEDLAKALASAMIYEDMQRRNNHIDTPAYVDAGDGGFLIRSAHASPASKMQMSVAGRPAELAQQWQEYIQRFCDPALGDQGCEAAPAPAISAGTNRDLPGMLFGEQQTINVYQNDMNAMKNMMAAMRTLSAPRALTPLTPEILNTPQGRATMLADRARNARINAIQNVIAGMLASRVSGSGVDVNDIRESVGLEPDTENPVFPAGTTGGGAAGGGESQAALREITTKAKYMDPNFAVRLVNSPEAVKRDELGVLIDQSAISQEWHDLLEPMLFMESAMYGHTLDTVKIGKNSLDPSKSPRTDGQTEKK